MVHISTTSEYSVAQLFFERRLKGKLHALQMTYKPISPSKSTGTTSKTRRIEQEDRHTTAKKVTLLQVGNLVSMLDPTSKCWDPAGQIIDRRHDQRWYVIKFRSGQQKTLKALKRKAATSATRKVRSNMTKSATTCQEDMNSWRNIPPEESVVSL